MASAYHVGAAVLAHLARRGQLDSALDERSFSLYQSEISSNALKDAGLSYTNGVIFDLLEILKNFQIQNYFLSEIFRDIVSNIRIL